MSEILSQATPPDAVNDAPFDSANEDLDPADPGWLYSIAADQADQTGLLSVHVTVARNMPASQHPTKFTLVRWVPDPNYTYTPPTSAAAGAASGS